MNDPLTKRLLLCGIIAGPLFTFAWIIESAIHDGYNPVRHPISSLALGEYGWMQTANFIITGCLTLAFAIGVWRGLKLRGGSTWGPLFIGSYAIGLIGAGLFITDPVSGYPPGTPDLLLEHSSTTTLLHDLFSIPVFVGLPIACFVFARRFYVWQQKGWSLYSLLSGLIFSMMFILASLGFGQVQGLVDYGGLFQRSGLTIGWTWLTLLALSLFR